MQAGLRLCCLQTTEDRFSRLEAHISCLRIKKKIIFFVSSDFAFFFKENPLDAGSFYYGFHTKLDIFSESVTVYNIKVE